MIPKGVPWANRAFDSATERDRRLRAAPTGATHRPVPRHSGRRLAHARPRPSSDVPASLLKAHPLTPLSERDRPRRPWTGRGRLAAVALAAVITVITIPLLGAALTPGAPQHPASRAPATAGGFNTGRTPVSLDGRLAPVRATDADGPLPFAQRGAPSVETLTGYRWPISKGRVSLPFKAIPGGEWINNGRLFHDGVDMASFCGASVVAAHDGVVIAAGRRFDAKIGWIGDLGP